MKSRFFTRIFLDPTKGAVTIAGARDVFTGHLDPDFKNWGTDITGKNTQLQIVRVHSIVENATFTQLFGEHGDPRSLCLTQGQIVKLCRTYLGMFHQNGAASFFLFEVKDELFVASVYGDVQNLEVTIYFFDEVTIWPAESNSKIVVPYQSS